MKADHPRITLLGNNSGRNLGDAAILSSILESLSQRLPDAEFFVPSIAPRWTEQHYGAKYRVKAVDVMPWTLSVRLLGLPTLRCLAKSDIALICDGIIFGKKLFNPAFNYLITLVFLVPLARVLGCKVVCFNCGIGPFPGRLSKWCARIVMNGSDLLTMRENDSRALAEEIGVTKPIEITGDSAFINPVSSRERGVEILRAEGLDPERPILAVNVTSYIDTWLTPDERVGVKRDLIAEIGEGIRRTRGRLGGAVQTAVFCTQPMDDAVCRRLSGIIEGPQISNDRYLSHDIQAAMRECGLLVGMRFHSLILASAVGVPIVGLVYAPKVRGYMRLLKAERYSIELAELDAERLAERLAEAWNQRREIQRLQQEVVTGLAAGAERATDLLCSRYFPECATAERAQLQAVR